MPSPYKEIPITFEKGLVTENEASLLDVGQAAELTNWEPSANGALRTRNAWSTISKTGLPATRAVRGWGAVATGGLAASITGPTIVQASHWPNGSADPVATKTITFTGVTIGHVLIACVVDTSGLTPTVTAGWTERAVSTGANEQVKFYTKTAASSTEAFTYTVTTSRIRAITVYEMAYLDSEDPGTKWAVKNDNGASSGTDSITVTTTDADGGFALVGYAYDGGTPDSADSGTSGWTTPTQDNANTATTVTMEDLDQLDGSTSTGSYVSPSWTPPATGMIVINIFSQAGPTQISASGNGLTWNIIGVGSYSGFYWNVAWADAALVTPTAGAITVTCSSVNFGCSFMKFTGADMTDPIGTSNYQSLYNEGGLEWFSASNLTTEVGSLWIAATFTNTGLPPLNDPDSLFSDDTPVDTGSLSYGYYQTYVSNVKLTGQNPHYCDFTTLTGADGVAGVLEIRGGGNAAKIYRGSYTGAGSLTENFDYLAYKNITAKSVAWGYTAPAAAPDAVQYYLVMALADGSTTYKVYYIERDSITTGTWTLVDTVTDADNSDAWVAFAQGANKLAWTASSLAQPRSIALATWSGTNITDMADKSGRAMAYHKDRLFIAGSSLLPSRLYFSDIGDPTSFTTATDYLDIGGDDGEPIQSIVSVEGLLLVAKTNRAYLISGSGIESFFVNELAGGSAASGRAAIRTPYGTILAGVDDIWVVQGGGVDPMSRPLGAGYAITGNASTAYAQDSVLIADSGTGNVWRVNLVTGAWALEEVAASNPVYDLFSLNGRLYYGVNGSTTQVGGTRQLSTDRTYDVTTGGLTLLASTGRVALLGPSVKYTPRWLYLQLRLQDESFPNELHVTITSDAGTFEDSVTVTETTQRERLDIGKLKGVEWIQISFEADASATAAAIDVERVVLGVDAESPR